MSYATCTPLQTPAQTPPSFADILISRRPCRPQTTLSTRHREDRLFKLLSPFHWQSFHSFPPPRLLSTFQENVVHVVHRQPYPVATGKIVCVNSCRRFTGRAFRPPPLPFINISKRMLSTLSTDSLFPKPRGRSSVQSLVGISQAELKSFPSTLFTV